MKFLFLVVVAGLMSSHVAAFRTRPPSSLNWNVDSGGYPDVDIDFEDENSDEEELKLDWHNTAPVIYSAPSRVVYAHHASQTDRLEDKSDENYDIGEHAPGPPMQYNPSAYSQDNLGSKEEDELSNEESKIPQFPSAQAPSYLDTSSLEYVPPPVVYSPPMPMPSTYMNIKPVPIATGSFPEYPLSFTDNVINKPLNRPKSLSIENYNPAPTPIAYIPPTPAPIVFNGPNSNAAIYSKPPTAQVVYKYALPSPFVNKEEESFPLQNEKSYYYEDDNTPDPMIYDSSEYSIAIDSESKYAPYMYSDLISPSNAFADTFSSQPFQKFSSFNHITPGFAKPAKDYNFLNLYAEPKQYDIEPFPVSSLADSIPKINGSPALISNSYADSFDNSKSQNDLEDIKNFNSIEYDDIDHDILDIIPMAYNEPKSEQPIDNFAELQVDDIPTDPIITIKETEDFDDIEYDDVDHDILDSIRATNNKPIVSNIKYEIDFQDISMEDAVNKLPIVKPETTTSTTSATTTTTTSTTTTTPKPKTAVTNVRKRISNQNANYDITRQASRITKMQAKPVNQVKPYSSFTNRLSRFSSRRSSLRSPSYSQRMSNLRSSLRESQRQKYRDISSEEKTHNIYSFRNRLRTATRGNPISNMRRTRGRYYDHESEEKYSSEERITPRRRASWGRRRQYRLNQSSEEDDDHDDDNDDDDNVRSRTRVSSRLNTRKQLIKTTTTRPTTTTVKSRRISSRGRSIPRNLSRTRSPSRQSLQCFLMSIVRSNYEC